MKITKSDGTTYYYYYKKRVGRPKKRGRKKKKKKRGRSWQESWNYKIVKCSFNKQTEFIGVFHNAFEVEQVKKKIIERNNEVVFPKVYVNNNKVNNDYNTLEVKEEYLVLQRKTTMMDISAPRLPNEYGKLIPHTTNSDTWRVYDKIPCVEEESFWIYGFNPKTERKTFSWIFENLVEEVLENTEYVLIQLFIYKNKLFFRYDDTDLDFVICKNQSDAIRMYNLINKRCQEKRYKRCFFTGSVKTCSEIGKRLINELQEKTGWTLRKIRSKST